MRHSTKILYIQKNRGIQQILDIQTTSVEKTNYLRCLYREGDTGNIRGTTTLSGGQGFHPLLYGVEVVWK